MCGIVGILNSQSLKSDAIEILKKLGYTAEEIKILTHENII